MSEKDVNIIDEEERVLTPEELEQIEENQRKERIKKAIGKGKKNRSGFSVFFKCVMGVGLLIMVISMLLESGVMMTVSLITVAVAGLVSYFFFDGK